MQQYDVLSSTLEHFEAFWSILKHFGALSSILEHSEPLSSTLEHSFLRPFFYEKRKKALYKNLPKSAGIYWQIVGSAEICRQIFSADLDSLEDADLTLLLHWLTLRFWEI